MSSQRRSIGDQELALLRFISEREQATVAEAVEGFGQPRGLARSTVLTMMDRLRRKGHLSRRPINGITCKSPEAKVAAGSTRFTEDRTGPAFSLPRRNLKAAWSS
jgi:predicted transcriptional regulator